jgi:hypothetical protein
LFGALILTACCSAQLRAQTNSNATKLDTAKPGAEGDGSHDFDFEIGAWKTHLKRLLHPLTGSITWVEYEGTSVVRKIWNGRANLLELEVDGPQGHIEALSLRLYNPKSHQWSLNFANSSGGSLGVPTIGDFRNGRGEFYDQETLNGRAILVRFVISDVTPNSAHFEQSFSDDGGKTWEVNWIATDTRITNESTATRTNVPPVSANTDGQHDFDFAMGSWKMHLSRLQNPLTGSNSWVQFDGTLVAQKIWDGRANFEEVELNSPTGPIEGLTLRLFDSETHQWSIYWSNSRNGYIDPAPQVGKFKNGRGELYGQDTLNGKFIYVRFVWTNTTSSSPHFEQSYSEDGGKTWEVNWITDQTRVKDESSRVH